MNTLTHFFTGYLIGRIMGKNRNLRNDHYLPFFVGIVAILPDIDAFLHLIIPLPMFDHAIFSHTIIGSLLLATIYITIVWLIGKKFLLNINVNLSLLIIAALLGIFSHLFLDIFTYREDIYTTNAHLYFWPIWNVSFHLNLFFHQSIYPNIYLVRILIEVTYTSILIIIIIFYGWFYKKENPFASLYPKNWLNYTNESDLTTDDKKRSYILFSINLAIIGLMIVGALG